MCTIASEITSLTVVYSTVYSDADQRKHQSSASLAFVRGINRRPVNSPHKWPITRKMFSFDDVIILLLCHRSNHTITSVPVKQPWRIQVNKLMIKNDDINTTKRSTTVTWVFHVYIVLNGWYIFNVALPRMRVMKLVPLCGSKVSPHRKNKNTTKYERITHWATIGAKAQKKKILRALLRINISRFGQDCHCTDDRK